MINLRPIGTEFEIDFGMDAFSTDPRGRKIKYKVTKHSSILRFPGGGVGELCESIEPVSVEYYDIDPSKYVWNFTYHG